jgi:hypothetical protein
MKFKAKAVVLVGAVAALSCVVPSASAVADTARASFETGLDVADACRHQHNDDSQWFAIDPGEGSNVYGWKCGSYEAGDGFLYTSPVNMAQACEDQHREAPNVGYRNFNDRYSWYCYSQ